MVSTIPFQLQGVSLNSSIEHNFVPILRQEPAVLVSAVITAMMTELYHVPRLGGTVLLAGLRDILRAMTGQENPGLDLAKDPRTIVKQLRFVISRVERRGDLAEPAG